MVIDGPNGDVIISDGLIARIIPITLSGARIKFKRQARLFSGIDDGLGVIEGITLVLNGDVNGRVNKEDDGTSLSRRIDGYRRGVDIGA